MDDTDPFGRSKDDDPLAEMGWENADTVKPNAGPADIASPEQADVGVERQERRETAAASKRGFRPAPSGIPGQKRRRSGCGCAIAAALLVLVTGVVVAVSVVADGIQAVEDAIPTLPQPPENPSVDQPAPQRDPPTGLEGASLLRRGNLAPALRRLERISKTRRVRLVRIDAQRVIVQAVTANGGTRMVLATWEGDARVLSTTAGGAGTRATFPWSRIDASAPNRVVRAATRGRKASSFDYLVLLDAAGLRWSAFLKAGRGNFQAAPDGTGVDKVG